MKTTCFFFSIIVFFLLGCDKYKAKKMAGIYDCKVHSSYFTGGTSNDSDYEEALEIKQDGKNLVIFNELFHVDLFRHENVYTLGGGSIQFVKDCVFIKLSSVSPGAKFFKEYRGRKRK
ncbi:MAG TPA: hypothetical protein PLI97_01605 [Fluviicola sp.]|nr:hypothetical protein [Fluviicola sp.]